ncbi:MAG: GGDEF domain-containing protein [Steroidobacteraceae bacterium]
MRYYELKKQSEEILRKILPLMAKQEAAYHPVSYTLWYEHVAGLNPGLQQHLSTRLDHGGPLSEEETYDLFFRYVLTRDTSATVNLEAAMSKAIKDVEESTITFNRQVTLYGQSLTRCHGDLGMPMEAAAARVMLDSLLGETKLMRESVAVLQARLEDSMSEVSKLRGELETAQGLAMTDALTGLHNRRAFELAMTAALAAEGEACSLILLDIDRFKQINDTFGHQFGDKVIRLIAQLIGRNIKGADFAARYAGDEFAVLLPATSAKNAAIVAEKIRAAVANGQIKGAQDTAPGKITISAGVAQALPNETGESLFGRADAALYAAKSAGRNQIHS